MGSNFATKSRNSPLGSINRFGLVVSCVLAWGSVSFASESYFEETITPILEDSCYDCHDYESKKGGFSIDDYFTLEEVSANKEQWFKAFKNLQAQVMPPPEKEPPTSADRQILLDWIKKDVFKIDPSNPDPGSVSHRRLNRIEYENTLFELTGIRIDAAELLPADDTGYGFDNIADALSISPLLLEKYIKIAHDVIDRSIPSEPYQLPQSRLEQKAFRHPDGREAKNQLRFRERHEIQSEFRVDLKGEYRLKADFNATRFFNFDYGKAQLRIFVNDDLKHSEEVIHSSESRRVFEFNANLNPSVPYRIRMELEPKYDRNAIESSMAIELNSVLIEGPLGDSYRALKPEYARFFPEGPASGSKIEQSGYAHRILKDFASRAYRRPPSDSTVDRLVSFAFESMERDNLSFEQGIAKSLTAILSSPRFLYRVEDHLPIEPGQAYAQIDEFALASRLSYFFWSNMPDKTLLDLASKGELRQNLDTQVIRMLEDKKADAFAENFVGQWLQSRDIPLIGLNERAILAGDGRPNYRYRLDGSVRRAMRTETEMTFEHILDGNRSLLELIDSNYTFLNRDLAEHYGIEGVTHRALRKVELPPDSYRGGILTQATILGVTSNPTRTSPVKRGLFILENILGTPAPPAPPDVPELEEAEKQFADGHTPNMRDLMAVHREEALCRSCHERMDPLGLALENFNAMGMWRDDEAGTEIDPSGVLVTGERFNDIRDLKRILANERRLDYYRVVSEKMLTYAIGRGLDYYDTHTIDSLVAELDSEGGKILTLVNGIVNAPAFQKTRIQSSQNFPIALDN